MPPFPLSWPESLFSGDINVLSYLRGLCCRFLLEDLSDLLDEFAFLGDFDFIRGDLDLNYFLCFGLFIVFDSLF